MSKQQIGVVGMAVMGRNLALNIERALLMEWSPPISCATVGR